SGLGRVEVALRRDLRPERCGVEQRDPAGGGAALGEAGPERLAGGTAGGDHPDPGDHDAAPTRVHRAAALNRAASSAVSVSTWPSSGRGASGPRWNTARTVTVPVLRSRCGQLIGTSSAWSG